LLMAALDGVLPRPKRFQLLNGSQLTKISKKRFKGVINPYAPT
jgi:hypothetical protein